MNKFKIICPECGAIIISAQPAAILWELCPGCHHHLWDSYDMLMADVYAPEKQGAAAQGRSVHADS